MRRHGGFDRWIRVAAGLPASRTRVVDVEAGEPLPAAGFAGAIVTGSAAMVTDRHDWSERTADWLRNTVAAGRPVLGICYGHQLLAHALGGEVGDSPGGRRMGTVQVSLLPGAQADPLFSGLPSPFSAQVTHMQRVLRAPPDAVLLASAGHDPCHAFRCGDAAWGVQFHPEFSVARMRGYLLARADALRAEGQDPHALISQLRAAPHARKVLRRFVQHASRLSRH